MAGIDVGYQIAVLKAATFHLTSVPIPQLPNVVPSLCAQLATCKDILSKDRDAAVKNDTDASAHVHRLKTRISSLLQDRSPEARWAGVVLAKTVVECGGPAILQDSLPWIHGLLSLLGRNEPTTSKRLAIICLTRIFILTHGQQTITREITTPNLPSFVGLCCQLLTRVPQLVHTVCEAFSQLIGRHPAIFRPYLSQLRPILTPLVGFVVSEEQPTDAANRAARTLFVRLHECAPKNAGPAEWAAALKQIITCVHEDIDQIFRCVLEDWESSAGYHPIQHSAQMFSTEPARSEKDALGLSPWMGMQQGGERVKGLLSLIRCYLATHTSLAVSVDLGAILDLTNRLLSMARPASLREWEANGRADTRFDRKEREELAIMLPDLHIESVRVADALLKRLGGSLPEVAEAIVQQCCSIFVLESSHKPFRGVVYAVISEALRCFGPSLGKVETVLLKDVAISCSKDLLEIDEVQKDLATQLAETKTNGVANNLSKIYRSLHSAKARSPMYDAASRLLPVLFTSLRADYIPNRMREEMDRAAVLTRNKAALIASVRNPSSRQPSLLPILARLFPDDNNVQLLIKPRMPVILQSGLESKAADDDDDMDETSEPSNELQNMAQPDYIPESRVPDLQKPSLHHLFPADHVVADSNNVDNGAESAPTSDPRVSEVTADVLDSATNGKRTLDTETQSSLRKRPRTDEAPSQPDDTDLAGPMLREEPLKQDRSRELALPDNNIEGRHVRDRSPHAPTERRQAMPPTMTAQQEADDSDEEDFVMPQLHLRSASDDEDG